MLRQILEFPGFSTSVISGSCFMNHFVKLFIIECVCVREYNNHYYSNTKFTYK
jgi:hypothetical protein